MEETTETIWLFRTAGDARMKRTTLWFISTVFILAFDGSVRLRAAEPIQPSPEQLEAAKKKFEAMGGLYQKQIGVNRVEEHVFVPPAGSGNAILKKLPDLPFSFGLDLSQTGITDKGLRDLSRMKHLSVLELNGVGVTDAGLKDLAELKELTVLSLGYTKVTDAGVKNLGRLTHLNTLVLADTKVTDETVKTLVELKHLAVLNINKTRITDAGVKELKAAFPNAFIYK